MQKILIVEDDKFLREMITRKLDKEDYETIQAVDGKEGLERMREEKPDLVLLDLIMPGVGGFEVLEEAKKDPEIESIPIVILSNLGQKSEVERGLDLGAEDFLIKAHFTPREIIKKIQETVS